MPGLADIRRRFRRLLAPPGQPAEALGVPSAGEDIEAELGALLTELDAVAAEAQRIDRDAEAEAERRRLAGIREAAVILEEARDRADAERARAASARTEAARAAVQAAQDAAQQRAAELRTQTEERIAGPLEEVLTCVRHFGRCPPVGWPEACAPGRSCSAASARTRHAGWRARRRSSTRSHSCPPPSMAGAAGRG